MYSYVTYRPQEIPDDKLREAKVLSERGWAYPGPVLFRKWLLGGDVTVFAYKGNFLVGFASAAFVDDNIINFTVTIVDKDYRNKGIASGLNRRILKYYFSNEKIIFKPLFIAFRTMNPLLYQRFYAKMSSTFPDYKNRNRSASQAEIAVFKKVTKYFSQGHQSDERKFIIFNATKDFPQLNYKKNSIPWSNNEIINKMFEKELHLAEGRGDAFLVVGSLSVVKKILYRLSSILIK